MSDNPSGWGRLDKQSLFAAILFVGSLVALGTWETWQGRVHAQDASAVTSSAGTPLGTFTIGEPPFDVPPKETESTRCAERGNVDCGFYPDDNEPVTRYRCDDTKRALTKTEDGNFHCYAFYLLQRPPNGAQR